LLLQVVVEVVQLMLAVAAQVDTVNLQGSL
jgi:hypothetical protein